ncbi:hypothetical protein PGQ11_003184 [Apiospora arundinis]|uniref:Uncharacterized protein n=1 Tax=Apiospora arundinis TaxID=335852 RepID=A0ABR2J4W7_9PEZI
MMNSGGDQLRIWLRNNSERLDWPKALELLEAVLDETDSEGQGADCIDAWMDWALPRFTKDEIDDGFTTARRHGLGDVYMVAWRDTDKALDEVEDDLLAKTELLDREEEEEKQQQQQQQQVGENTEGADEGEDNKDDHRDGDRDDSGSSVGNGSELSQEVDQLLQEMDSY